MIYNYLKLSFRLLLRSPFFTMINVLGLATGFSVFFILWQYSQNELRSDQFHKDWKRIARLTFQIDDDVFHERTAVIHPAFSRQLAQRIPELSDHTLVGFQNEFHKLFTGDHGKEIAFTYIDKRNEKTAFKETKVVYADRNVFDFFNIDLIEGERMDVLQEPNSIVLSQKLALKYFGKAEARGSVLLLNDSISLVVSGVFRDLPRNSHLAFEAVIPIARIQRGINQIDFSKQAWFNAYFKLPASVDRDLLIKKIEDQKSEILTEPFAKLNWSVNNWKTRLQPFHEIVFEKIRGDDFTVKSRPLMVVFGVIGIVVLAMAWINFTNLTITANRRRMKELAARLIVGARPGQFVTQFMVEAIVVNVISLLLAVTLVQLAREPVSVLLNISIPFWSDISFLSAGIIATIVVSGVFFSGIYPALVTLRRTPSSLFKKSAVRKSYGMPANILTTFQFCTALILITWSFAVYAQISFVLTKDLGFKRDEVIIVDLPYLPAVSFETDLSGFLEKLRSLPGIKDQTVSTSVAGDNEPIGIVLRKREEHTEIGAASDGGVDERYIDFYNIRLIAGRNFRPDHPADRNSVIVSKNVLDRLSIHNPADAIGVQVLILQPGLEQPAEIIGVMEDYNRTPLISGFQSYWNDDLGIGLTYGKFLQPQQLPRKVSIEVERGDFSETIKQIRFLYAASFHGSLFNWYFLDNHINRHYQDQKIIRNQITVFTGVAIGIACLGLLGTISYKVIDKNKEIGIRKVLGARIYQIAKMLLDTTVRQIGIASMLGLPLAYYLVAKYNAGFKEQLPFSWKHYLLPLFILTCILFASILTVVWRAARTNPVESLRQE